MTPTPLPPTAIPPTLIPDMSIVNMANQMTDYGLAAAILFGALLFFVGLAYRRFRA